MMAALSVALPDPKAQPEGSADGSERLAAMGCSLAAYRLAASALRQGAERLEPLRFPDELEGLSSEQPPRFRVIDIAHATKNPARLLSQLDGGAPVDLLLARHGCVPHA